MGLGSPARDFSGDASSYSESQDARSARQQVSQLAEMRRVHDAFAWFRANSRYLEDIQLEVTAIPAPPWGEAERCHWMRDRFAALGLHDVHQDELGNVFGLLPGSEQTAKLVALSAHLDTVFPPETPITAHREVGKLYGPGISDNGSGIAALLALAAAIKESGIVHRSGILFIGNVGEEGEGDLRGMRHIFQQRQWLDSIGTLVAVDGAGTDTIIAEGLGSRRYEVTLRGPGGHSWSDFGVPNPIIAAARVIERFTRTSLPTTTKTTYNIGVISGGTSVNSIPESATFRVDTRSASVAELDRLERALRESIEELVPEMVGRKRQEVLSSEVRIIGNRPAADLPVDANLLKLIRAVDAQLGITARIQRASTDANIPLSLGREAAAIGAGGTGGGAHTIHEWYDPANRDLGLKRILLLTLALSGVSDE